MSLGKEFLLDGAGELLTTFANAPELTHYADTANRLARKSATWPGTQDELYITELDVVLSTLAGNGTLITTGQQNQLAELGAIIQPFVAAGFGDATYNGTYTPTGQIYEGKGVWQNTSGRVLYLKAGTDGVWILNTTVSDQMNAGAYN